MDSEYTYLEYYTRAELHCVEKLSWKHGQWVKIPRVLYLCWTSLNGKAVMEIKQITVPALCLALWNSKSSSPPVPLTTKVVTVSFKSEIQNWKLKVGYKCTFWYSYKYSTKKKNGWTNLTNIHLALHCEVARLSALDLSHFKGFTDEKSWDKLANNPKSKQWCQSVESH